MSELKPEYNLEALSKHSVAEIDQIIVNAKKARAIAASVGLKELMETFEALAAEKGISIDEALEEAYAIRSVKAKLPAKFAHPEDPSKRWAGRGHTPNWVKQWIEDGGNMDDLKI